MSNVSDTSTTNSAKPKVKVLIVEDEPDAVTIFENLLQTDPKYEVHKASNGVEALETLKGKDFDLVLMDIIMPKMDGIEALKEVRANPDLYGDPSVLMLTNVGGDQAVKDSAKYEADGYILKIEIEPKELLEKIDSFLSKRKDGKRVESGIKEEVEETKE